MEISTAGIRVNRAESTLDGSAALVAVTIKVTGSRTDGGAMYVPSERMVPMSVPGHEQPPTS